MVKVKLNQFHNSPFFLSQKYDKITIFGQNGPKWNISPPKIWELCHYIERIGTRYYTFLALEIDFKAT